MAKTKKSTPKSNEDGGTKKAPAERLTREERGRRLKIEKHKVRVF